MSGRGVVKATQIRDFQQRKVSTKVERPETEDLISGNFRYPLDWHLKITTICQQRNISRSQLMREILKDYLDSISDSGVAGE